MQNFQIDLTDTGALEMEANVKYIRNILRVEAPCKFDLVSADTKKQKPYYIWIDYLRV